MDLNDIQSFVAVAKTGSFTEGAKQLGVPKSYVSRKVLELEARLKVRLLERTTRSVRLTDDGERYFASCERALNEIAEIENVFESGHAEPQGIVRLTCPVEFGPFITRHLLGPIVQKYPSLQIEIVATNTIMDLVNDRIDIAVRPLHLADPSVKHIKMGNIEWGLYASQKWIYANKQNLQNIANLKNLDMIAFNPNLRMTKKWICSGMLENKKWEIEYTPRAIASNLSVLLEMVCQNAGIAALPEFIVKEYAHGKSLVRIFPKFIARNESIGAIYNSSKNMPTRVRVVLDALKMVRFDHVK